MLKFIGPLNSGVAVGANGVATANADSTQPVSGWVLAVRVTYNDSPPGTTDATVATKGASPAPPSLTILSLANNATDGWYYPRIEQSEITGEGAGRYDYPYIHDALTITIAQANAGDSVDVWLLMDLGARPPLWGRRRS